MLNAEVRANPLVVKNISRISDVFRHSQTAEKEIRIREAEIARMRVQLETRRAEVSNLVLSTAVLVVNLSQERQIHQIDRIFLEGDEGVMEDRMTINEVSRFIRMIYAVDPLHNPPEDYVQEINNRTRDFAHLGNN